MNCLLIFQDDHHPPAPRCIFITSWNIQRQAGRHIQADWLSNPQAAPSVSVSSHESLAFWHCSLCGRFCTSGVNEVPNTLRLCWQHLVCVCHSATGNTLAARVTYIQTNHHLYPQLICVDSQAHVFAFKEPKLKVTVDGNVSGCWILSLKCFVCLLFLAQKRVCRKASRFLLFFYI